MAKETLTLLKGDVSKEARAIVKPKATDFKKAVFTCTFEMDKSLAEKLDTDARFVSKLYDDITKDYEDLIGKVAYRWKEADNLATIIPLSPQEEKELVGEIKSLFEDARKTVTRKAESHVDGWLQKRKDRTKYTRSVKWNVAVGTFSLASGAGSLAAGVVTGGTSIVLTIVSIAKGIAKLAKEIKRVSQDVGKAQDQLQRSLDALMASYANDKKWKTGAKETGKYAVAAFVGYEMNSIQRVGKELVTYKGKVAPLHNKTADLGKDLNKLLDAQTELDKKVARELDKLTKGITRKVKKLGELTKAVEANRKSVQGLIGDLSAMDKVLDDHDAFTRDSQDTIDKLKSNEPGWTKWAQRAVALASIAANPAINAVATNGESLEKLADGLKRAYDAVADEVGV